MKIYVKIFIALALMSAGVVSYAEDSTVAKQDADSLTVLEFESAGVYDDYNDWNYRDFKRWYRHYRNHDGKGKQLRFGIGRSSGIVSDNFSGNGWYISTYSLEEYYMDYRGPISSAGSYSIGFQYYLTRNFSVGVDASTEILWHDMYDSISNSKVGSATGVAISLLPQIRVSYINRPMFRVYSSFSLGLIAYIADYSNTRGSYAENHGTLDYAAVAWHLGLLGCEIGQTFFVFAESGIGHLYIGGEAGIGLRGGMGYRF